MDPWFLCYLSSRNLISFLCRNFFETLSHYDVSLEAAERGFNLITVLKRSLIPVIILVFNLIFGISFPSAAVKLSFSYRTPLTSVNLPLLSLLHTPS